VKYSKTRRRRRSERDKRGRERGELVEGREERNKEEVA